jgi:hypothetical protein
MQVRFAAGFNTRDAEAKRNHFRPLECSQDLAANFIRDNKQPQWKKIDVGETPDFLLKTDRLSEFFLFRNRADVNFR